MKECVEMCQAKTKKEHKYWASILLVILSGISVGISALSPLATEHPLIFELSITLSKIWSYLLVLAVVIFIIEVLWRKWGKEKGKNFIGWLQNLIKNAVKDELESNLKAIKENMQTLCDKTSEKVITDTVQQKIIGPIHDNIGKGTKEILDGFEDSVTLPVKEIHSALKEENFKFLQTDATPLETFIQSHNNINQIRIICYGRNGYNKFFRYIEEHQKKIDCEIVVCDPELAKDISAQGDDKAISDQISALKRKNRQSGIRNIYKTKIIPSIRAVVLYTNEHAIWASYEPYIFNWEDGKNVLRRAGSIDGSGGTLIVELDKENTIKKDEFIKVVELIEKEFDRLKAESTPCNSKKARSKGAEK